MSLVIVGLRPASDHLIRCEGSSHANFFRARPIVLERDPGCHRNRCNPTVARGERLGRRDQTAAPFIEKRGHRRKPLSDGSDIDHYHNMAFKLGVNPYITPSKVDSIIDERALSTKPGN